nr:winged helix-turn-helix domain-containing protein [Pseudonocardia acidicola]
MSGLLGSIPDVRAATVTALGALHLAAPARGVFDLRNQELAVDGSATRLTPRESAVLTYLVKRPNAAVSREELRDAVDDTDGSLGPRAVDVILSRLRAKLPWMPPPLTTVRGIGYRYEPSAQFVVLGDTPAGTALPWTPISPGPAPR